MRQPPRWDCRLQGRRRAWRERGSTRTQGAWVACQRREHPFSFPFIPSLSLGGRKLNVPYTPVSLPFLSSPLSRSPSRNLFRFKSDGASGLGTPPESPYSLSPVGGDGPQGTALASPRRSPRKIARSPFKVLDAPALQDDFYLNLVDWSSHNVLAVVGGQAARRATPIPRQCNATRMQ